MSQIRHENRVNFLFHTFLIVISSSHLACSQVFKSAQPAKKPFVINNVASYKNSISGDKSKELVPLQLFVEQLFTDLKYATKNNFTGHVLYTDAKPYMRLEAAVLLKKINEELADSGLAIKVFDAYRPYFATKKMWNLVHDERYAANPAKGSGHNRGAAIDLTLVKISSGEEIPMPTAFDDFSEKAHHDYMKLSPEIIKNRALLRRVMEKHGFVALETEWWHYSLPAAAKKFELLDLSFKELNELTKNEQY